MDFQVNANPLQPGDPNNPMDTYDPLDMFPDDVFPDTDLGQELGNMGQGMEGMDFMDILDDHPFDPQPGSPNAIQDRARQSSRTNEPSSVSSLGVFSRGTAHHMQTLVHLHVIIVIGYYTFSIFT